jgi:hypothetical protein
LISMHACVGYCVKARITSIAVVAAMPEAKAP